MLQGLQFVHLPLIACSCVCSFDASKNPSPTQQATFDRKSHHFAPSVFLRLIAAAISSSLLRMRIKRAAAPLATFHSVADTLIAVAQQQVAHMVFSPSYRCFLQESPSLQHQPSLAGGRGLSPYLNASTDSITQCDHSGLELEYWRLCFSQFRCQSLLCLPFLRLAYRIQLVRAVCVHHCATGAVPMV